MTTTDTVQIEPVPDVPMSKPTSRLHAAANALAVWDHTTGSGEDVGHEPEVLPEHWDGAKAVWDALQPKIEDAAGLDALGVEDAIVRHTREGVRVWFHERDGRWRRAAPTGMRYRAQTSTEVLEGGSVRLLWTRAS